MWHIIAPGDTLSKLAGRFLGDIMKYPLIFNQNTDILPDENTVRLGQKIWIPIGGKQKPSIVPTASVSTGVPVAVPAQEYSWVKANGPMVIFGAAIAAFFWYF